MHTILTTVIPEGIVKGDSQANHPLLFLLDLITRKLRIGPPCKCQILHFLVFKSNHLASIKFYRFEAQSCSALWERPINYVRIAAI